MRIISREIQFMRGKFHETLANQHIMTMTNVFKDCSHNKLLLEFVKLFFAYSIGWLAQFSW